MSPYGDASYGPSRFIEELGPDRGLHVAVFRTEPEAAEWLKNGHRSGN